MKDKGHLGVGDDADVTVYDLRPEVVDPSIQHDLVKKALAVAKYTIKEGVLVSRDGEIMAAPEGRTFWVDASMPKERIMADLK